MSISKRTKALLDLEIRCEQYLERTVSGTTPTAIAEARMWLHLDMPRELADILHLTEKQMQILRDIIGMAVVA